MKSSDILKLLAEDPEQNSGNREYSAKLIETVDFDFRSGFEEKILEKVYVEKSFNIAFYRIAFTAAAAVALLIISIYLKEGSFSFDSLLGINDVDSETIVCLLTGK